jgi:hypothetical protein
MEGCNDVLPTRPGLKAALENPPADRTFDFVPPRTVQESRTRSSGAVRCWSAYWAGSREMKWEWSDLRLFWAGLAEKHILVRYDGRGSDPFNTTQLLVCPMARDPAQEVLPWHGPLACICIFCALRSIAVSTEAKKMSSQGSET